MAKMVKIHSTVTINVTAGLQNKDVTNPDAHVPDRLKVSAEWPRHTVLIREGQHLYPAEIKSWNTVKALANDKILTIGEEVEVEDGKLSEEESKLVESAQAAQREFRLGEPEDKHRRRRNLAEMVGEDDKDE